MVMSPWYRVANSSRIVASTPAASFVVPGAAVAVAAGGADCAAGGTGAGAARPIV